MARRTHPLGLLGGLSVQQLVIYNVIELAILVGRRLQGGDRPIAPGLRWLYAGIILAATTYVAWTLWRDRDRLVHRVLRLAARSRQRPILALYLTFWLALGVSFFISVMIAGIGRGLATLWSGGSLGLATFAGDNSADVNLLAAFLMLTLDVAAVGACVVRAKVGGKLFGDAN